MLNRKEIQIWRAAAGRELGKRRTELRLSQQDLTKLSGIPRGTISRAEGGTLGLTRLLKLCDALDLKLQLVEKK